MMEISEATKKISVLNNPFTSNAMESLFIHASKTFGQWRYTANIEYKNGETVGRQYFTGTSVGDVLLKMDAFMKELNQ